MASGFFSSGVFKGLMLACVACGLMACVAIDRAPVEQVGPPQADPGDSPELAQGPVNDPEPAPEAKAGQEPVAEQPAPDAAAVAAKPAENFDRDDVVWIQERLQQMGYYEGRVDGEVGQATRAAVRDYQKDQNIKVDGRPTRSLREFIWRNGG